MVNPAFAVQLAGYDLEALDNLESSIVGLWPDLTIAYTNPYWARFALENGGADVLVRWALGAPICTAVSEDLREPFAESLRQVASGGAPWSQEYECSSALVYRRFNMRVQRVRGGSLLVTHVLVVSSVRESGDANASFEANYRDVHGLIKQCSYCRRVNRPGANAWDWVPDFVERPPPRISHGVCPPCVGYYFPSP